MPALPVSKTELTRVGRRIATNQGVEGDEGILESCLFVYDEIRQSVVERLRDLDWNQILGRDADLNVTSRTKSKGTILDKVRREERFELGRIHDLAGVRIDGSLTLDEQDLAAREICSLYPDDPKLKDRRSHPQMGYRALHVIVRIESLPCEVQVRTRSQHAWANIYEAVGDRYGRWIRYPDSKVAHRI